VEIGEAGTWVIKGLVVSPSWPSPPGGRPGICLPGRTAERGQRRPDRRKIASSIRAGDRADGPAGRVTKPASGIWLGRHGRQHVARNNYV